MTDSDTTLTKAGHLLAIGRIDEARALVGDALASDPDNPALHLQLARVHHAAGDHDATLESAERALARQPSVDALHLAAVAERGRRRWDRSRQLLDQAIALEPDAPRLHVGRALTDLGPWLFAAETADDRRERDAARDEGRVTEALRAAATAAALDPELPLVPYARAFAAVALDDLPGAARELTLALELDPEWSAAHLVLARVRAAQGMGRLASRHAAAAGRLDPGGGDALGLLRRLATPAGWRARRRGRHDLSRVVPEAQRILEADLRMPTMRT